MRTYENRWDEVERVLNPGAADALKQYYAMCGTSMLTALASLWEPEIGGFYYAESARDTLGFLPDAESVRDALGILSMTDYGKGTLAEALPFEMKDRICSFLKSLQDKDGYFYHPQWGKNINSSRRGRDLSWCVQTLAELGDKPIFPTPLETAEDGGDTSLPDYLKSREAFIAYFEGLDIPRHSHSGGHTLSSQRSQIEAAGLIDLCCDLLASLQRPDNGLWEETTDYTTISGMYKIAGIFASAHRRLNYTDKIAESCMKCILSPETPSVIIYVMNPWGSLSRLFEILKNANAEVPGTYDLAPLYQMVRDRAEDLISVTTEKIALFLRDNGLFSYYRHYSAPITQAVSVSTGRCEGDLNASAKPIRGIPEYMFNCFGIEEIPFYNQKDFASFLEKIGHATPPVKVNPVNRDEIPLEMGRLPARIATMLSQTATERSFVGVVSEEDGTFIKMTTEPDSISRVILHTPAEPESVGTVVGFDLKVVSGDKGRILQLYLGSSDSLCYQISFESNGKSCSLYDLTNPDSKDSESLGISFPMGAWVRLRLTYKPKGGTGKAISIYKDGELVAESDRMVLLPPDGKPATRLPENVNFFTPKQKSAEFHFRHLFAYHE